MKKRIIISALCLACAFAATAKEEILKSPDGRITVNFSAFLYSVTVDGDTVIEPSPLSMTLTDGTVYGGDARLRGVVRESVNRTLPTHVYKRASVTDRYNQMTLKYKDFNLVFRAYDEGVAYRFVSKSSVKFDVRSECADFCFPGNWKAYVPYCNRDEGTALDEQLACSFENTYEYVSLKDWDRTRAAFLPIVVESPCGYKIAITEADLFNYPGLCIQNTEGTTTLTGVHARYPKDVEQGGHNNLQGVVLSREDFIAKDCEPGAAFPWRVIQIAREDKELAGSDMVWKLARPAAEGDWSWVKPGKVAWDWWNDWNVYGVGFKSGINNDTYKYYIDFASENGIEYVILDEGWAVNLQADLMQVIPEIDLVELCAYAEEKGVALILWAGYLAADKDMDNVFRHYSQMGVKGFKVDFMDRDDQEVVNFYTRCAETAARYKLMVDFHGAYKPTGLQRTYPNVVNFEGVHGLEQLKWEDSDKQVVYDVTIPFIRMMAGPMDYTQGAMRNATRDNYHPVGNEPMSLGTRCRQLAEYVIFDAPFTMLCDSPSNYMREPECTEFISAIPTVWDETVALDGRISEYILMARRSGNVWYAGAMTDWEERDMKLDLSFLPSGSYKVKIYRDGVNADRAARDFAIEERIVSSGETIDIHMAPGGGWAASFETVAE